MPTKKQPESSRNMVIKTSAQPPPKNENHLPKTPSIPPAAAAAGRSTLPSTKNTFPAASSFSFLAAIRCMAKNTAEKLISTADLKKLFRFPHAAAAKTKPASVMNIAPRTIITTEALVPFFGVSAWLS